MSKEMEARIKALEEERDHFISLAAMMSISTQNMIEVLAMLRVEVGLAYSKKEIDKDLAQRLVDAFGLMMGPEEVIALLREPYRAVAEAHDEKCPTCQRFPPIKPEFEANSDSQRATH